MFFCALRFYSFILHTVLQVNILTKISLLLFFHYLEEHYYPFMENVFFWVLFLIKYSSKGGENNVLIVSK